MSRALILAALLFSSATAQHPDDLDGGPPKPCPDQQDAAVDSAREVAAEAERLAQEVEALRVEIKRLQELAQRSIQKP